VDRVSREALGDLVRLLQDLRHPVSQTELLLGYGMRFQRHRLWTSSYRSCGRFFHPPA
jgi:hypothetical protein